MSRNRSKKKLILDDLPWNTSALQCSEELIARVTAVGFQWSDLGGPLDKVEEELREFRAELEKPPGQRDESKIADELGDFLFTICNMAHLLKVDTDDALKGVLRRFRARFDFVETELARQGKKPEESDLQEMSDLWDEAKRRQRSGEL